MAAWTRRHKLLVMLSPSLPLGPPSITSKVQEGAGLANGTLACDLITNIIRHLIQAALLRDTRRDKAHTCTLRDIRDQTSTPPLSYLT
jgi:hypothetical protein